MALCNGCPCFNTAKGLSLVLKTALRMACAFILCLNLFLGKDIF